MTQTREERLAYLREYNLRPEVVERRRVWHKERHTRMTDEELAERREYQRQWIADQRANMTDEERELRRARDRAYQRKRRAESRAERSSTDED